MKNLKEFEGLNYLEDIQRQIEVFKAFAVDHRAQKGRHRETLERLHPQKITYQVTEIREQCRDVKTFRLAAVNGYLPPFRPGQYINLELEVNGVRTSRAYTISSPVTQRAYYEITVKRTPTAFCSEWLLDHVQVGDTLSSSAPTGTFYRVPCVHGKRLVFIAGGSGITPFMSMLQTDFEKQDNSYDIDLIYGCALEQDIIFKKELDALAAKGVCRVHYVISNPSEYCSYRTGFITKDLLQEIAGDTDNCTFYLCGPTAMYNFVTKALGELNVPRRAIRREVEVPPADPTKLPGWPEGIDSSVCYTITLTDGRTLQATATETIMQALERAGIVIPNLCRSGECSTCRTKLVSGKVFQPGSELLRKSDMKMGYIHPCVTYPMEDIVIALP